jgi:hypothetical protein
MFEKFLWSLDSCGVHNYSFCSIPLSRLHRPLSVAIQLRPVRILCEFMPLHLIASLTLLAEATPHRAVMPRNRDHYPQKQLFISVAI